MTQHYLDFEKKAMELAAQMAELKAGDGENAVATTDAAKKLKQLQKEERQVLEEIYQNLTPWQRTQVARHPQRPHASDYINHIFEGFTPICGDRRNSEDPAMIAGIGRLNGQPVAVLGTEKGKDTKTRMRHNFGMPRPEGYRKAQRLMDLANQFGMPIVTFVDTPGAYPGIDAEARGQAEAIATCIQKSFQVNVPIVAYITGEGGSGGALAIATADRVFMLENSIYSVISPEGCASILWRDKAEADKAAKALKLTAENLKELGVIDDILTEPAGGAHRHQQDMLNMVKTHVEETLKSLASAGVGASIYRRERFLKLVPPSQK